MHRKSGDHPRGDLQDSQHGLFSKHSRGPLSPLSALAAFIGTTKEWHFTTTISIPKPALPGWKPCQDRREIKGSDGTREQAYALGVPVCVRFYTSFSRGLSDKQKSHTPLTVCDGCETAV